MEERIYLAYSPSSKEDGTGAQSRTLEAVTEAEIMENTTYWLIPHSFFTMAFETTQDHHYAGKVPPTVDWALQYQLVIKTDKSTGQSDGSNPSIMFPSSQVHQVDH